MDSEKTQVRKGWMARRIARIGDAFSYFWTGIWSDRRSTAKVRLLKTANLSLRTLIDPDLQTRAYALTFNTLLSIVPTFALLLAICKGFGLQDMLQTELISFFPSQKHVAQTLMTLVDSYLSETSHGVFLGVGIVFLLYTVITLMSQIEDNFNHIWGVFDDRTMYQKLVDYLAVCLLVPIMLICSFGLNVFMNNAFRVHFHIPVLSPLIGIFLDLAPFFLVCIAFTFSFYWIPHAKVKLKYALVTGIICGVAFQILQLVFLNGQIFLSRYNAIYGSFAFLPLFLLWLWISWLIVLSGCVVTYSAQFVFCFPFTESIENVSRKYYTKVLVVITAIIASRHLRNQKPMSIGELSVKYQLPVRLVNRVITALRDAELIYFVSFRGRSSFDDGIVPAVDLNGFTVADLLKRLEEKGTSQFIPEFEENYGKIVDAVDAFKNAEYDEASTVLLRDIALTVPENIVMPDTTGPSK